MNIQNITFKQCLECLETLDFESENGYETQKALLARVETLYKNALDRERQLLDAMREIAGTPPGSMVNDSEALRERHHQITLYADMQIRNNETKQKNEALS